MTLDSQEPSTGPKGHLDSVLDFACGSGSLLLNVRSRMGPHGIGKICGREKNITTYNLARMNMLLHGVKDSEIEIYHGDTLTNDGEFLRQTHPAKAPKLARSALWRRKPERDGMANDQNRLRPTRFTELGEQPFLLFLERF